jgi:hypothetical protein
MERRFNTTRTIVLAGIAGGTVEIIWVLLHCIGSPLQASLVAEEVARSFLPQMVGLTAVLTGLLIHYVLALLIAAVAVFAYLRTFAGDIDEPAIFATSIAALVAIWAANFFVVLPVVNPDFVTLMPYTVTLISKIGFGITMGWIFTIWGVTPAGHTKHTAHRRLALR